MTAGKAGDRVRPGLLVGLLVASALSPLVSNTAQALPIVNTGFWYDDHWETTGTTISSLTVGTGLSGTISFGQLLTTAVEGSLVRTAEVPDDTVKYFEGTAAANGSSYRAEFMWKVSDRLLVATIVRPNGQGIKVITAPEPTISLYHARAMAARVHFVIEDSPNMPDWSWWPWAGQNLKWLYCDPPYQYSPCVPPERNTIHAVERLLLAVLPPEPGAVDFGMIERGLSPPSNDYSVYDAGGQVRFGFHKLERNADFSSSYNDISLDGNEIKMAFDVGGYGIGYNDNPDCFDGGYNYYSYCWTEGETRTHAWVTDWPSNSPLTFEEAGSLPENGQTSSLSLGIGIPIGYGPVSIGFEIGTFLEDSDGGVQRDTDSSGCGYTDCHAWIEVDWGHYDDAPNVFDISNTAKHGMEVYLHSSAGTPAYYRLEALSVLDYERWFCISDCYVDSYEISSNRANSYTLIQAANWDPGKRVANGFDFDVGDSALSTVYEPLDPWPTCGEENDWLLLCGGHRFDYYPRTFDFIGEHPGHTDDRIHMWMGLHFEPSTTSTPALTCTRFRYIASSNEWQSEYYSSIPSEELADPADAVRVMCDIGRIPDANGNCTDEYEDECMRNDGQYLVSVTDPDSTVISYHSFQVGAAGVPYLTPYPKYLV